MITGSKPHGDSIRIRCGICKNTTAFWEDEFDQAIAIGKRYPAPGQLGRIHDWLILEGYPPANPAGFVQGKCRACLKAKR